MTSSPQHRISQVHLDSAAVAINKPEIEYERIAAINDLLHGNYFSPRDENDGSAYEGPFDVRLHIHDNRLFFDIRSSAGMELTEVALPLAPFRSIIRDYFMICDSYFEAIKSANSSRVEALDMGRRGVHNEGSEMLKKMLDSKIEIDFDTARRLFTLICVLHIR